MKRSRFLRAISLLLLFAMLAGCAQAGKTGQQETTGTAKSSTGGSGAETAPAEGRAEESETAPAEGTGRESEAAAAEGTGRESEAAASEGTGLESEAAPAEERAEESETAAGAGTAEPGAAEFSEPQEEALTEQQKTEKMIREYIQTLSLEDKVSGLFIITPEALSGYEQVTGADGQVQESLETYPVAGLVFFAQNIQSREQVQQMLTSTKEWGSVWIGEDNTDSSAAEAAGAQKTADSAVAEAAGAQETADSAAAEDNAAQDTTEMTAAADTSDAETAQRKGFPVPPFLAIDEEGGIVARIGNSSIDVPYVGSMGNVGASGDPEAAYEAGCTIGAYLQELGFNLDFAPDADVLIDPGNVTIGERSFGSDPALCGEMVHRYVDGLHKYGIASCIKHFPGLGDTESDTHTGSAWSSRTIEDYRGAEFLSFGGGIDAQTEMVMISHLSNSELSGSDIPASLNKTIITDILRGELGYDGIVITDSLRMGAVTERFASVEAALAAVEAGADLLLMPADFSSARQGILDAVRDGQISEERIDQSLFRILCARTALK